MPDTRMKGTLERGAVADLCRNTLAQIPSYYGRLVYLAGLRNADSGKYEHHGLALVFGDVESDKALRKMHLVTFQGWLGFSLEQQRTDLDVYLSNLEPTRKVTVETWSRLAPYRALMPAHARRSEKALFLSDFEALLALMQNEFGVASPDRDA